MHRHGEMRTQVSFGAFFFSDLTLANFLSVYQFDAASSTLLSNASFHVHPANFDWQISFPPRDVDLSHVRAKFDEGHLTILVPRYRAMLSVIAACCAF